MQKLYSITDAGIMEANTIEDSNQWIHLINPTEEESQALVERFGIKPIYMKASLDNDENSRIEAGNGQLFILVNIPYKDDSGKFDSYNTLPLGIILTERVLLTVTLMENEVIEGMPEDEIKGMNNRVALVYKILLRMVNLYLKYLKEIEKKSAIIEDYINKFLKNEELIKLLNLEHSLVYFSTALRSNQTVMEKIFSSYVSKVKNERYLLIQTLLERNEDNEDNLKELIVENKQAIALIDIYTNILSNTMDAFASIISNNLNIVMKFLTVVTISLAIPAIVTSFYGMNVNLPFQERSLAYIGIILLSVALMFVVAGIVNRKRF